MAVCLSSAMAHWSAAEANVDGDDDGFNAPTKMSSSDEQSWNYCFCSIQTQSRVFVCQIIIFLNVNVQTSKWDFHVSLGSCNKRMGGEKNGKRMRESESMTVV